MTRFDVAAEAEALARHDRLAKPAGSLGELEALGARLAGMAGVCPPPVPEPVTVVVFAADHGVVASGVTPWPQEITAAMVSTFAAGRAAVNALARQVGASVLVVDVGVATPYPPSPVVADRKVRPGTADLSAGAAMARDEALAAVEIGRSVALELGAGGAGLLVAGDMGIGNTTAAAAVTAAITGRSAQDATGRGTGIDDAMLAHKRAVVAAALERAVGWDAVGILAEVGGLEIAALAGFALGAAAAGVPLVLDGVVTLAGALVAHAVDPHVLDVLIAGHRSPEPAASLALDHLGLRPLLDLGLRLGEGTGGLLAVPLVQAAARVLGEMATLDELG
jgi:nicotinate-nucleotide--dimethylbenzimidazole phosphoribosyltransferase